MPKKKISKVKGYKAFEKDLTCKGFQYEVGKEYKLPDGEKLKICESGFHFCKTIANCYNYYPIDGDTRICEIEALGNIVADEDDNKFATDHIKIVKEITDQDILHCNTGINNSGYLNSGDSNSGDYNTGNCNSGNNNSGNYNSGYFNSGDWNTGFYNSGDSNSGEWNTGDFNSGDYNSGEWNTGDFNSGDWNTGDFNSGDYNSGCFCTIKNPKIKMFNKESDWTVEDWVKSRAKQILSTIPFHSINWVPFLYMTDKLHMTDEEKEEHPEAEVTGGYPKEIKVTDEDRQKWWDELSDDSKNEILSLPNFDPEKFKICTGIDVWQSFNQLPTDDDNSQDCNTTEDNTNTISINEPKIMNQSTDSYSVMEEDGLYLYTPIYSKTPGLCTKHKIMDKETFILCYNEWIAPKNISSNIPRVKKKFIEFKLDVPDDKDDMDIFSDIIGPSIVEYDDGENPFNTVNSVELVCLKHNKAQYSVKIPYEDESLSYENGNSYRMYLFKAIKILMEYLSRDNK